MGELGQGSAYRGYTLWKRETWDWKVRKADVWGAYTGSPVAPWFTADTPEELVKLIDEAHAELPVPVY